MIFQIPEIVLNILRFIDKLTLFRSTSLVSSNFYTLTNHELQFNRKTKWEKVYNDFKTNERLQTKNLKTFEYPDIKFLLDDNSGLIIIYLKENDMTSIYFSHFFDTQKLFLHICNVDVIIFKELKITEIIPQLSVTGKTERILNIQTNYQTIYVIYTNVNDIRTTHTPISLSLGSLVWKPFKNDIRQYPIFSEEKSCVDFETESNFPKVLQFICPRSDKEVYIINFSRDHGFFVVYLFNNRELIKRTPIEWKQEFCRSIIKTIPNSKEYIIVNNYSKFHMFDLKFCKIIKSFKCDNLFDIKRVYLVWNQSTPVFIGFCYDGIYIYNERDSYTKIEFGMNYHFGYDEELKQILCNNFYLNQVFRIHLNCLFDLPKKTHYLFSHIKPKLKIHYNGNAQTPL